MRAVRQPAHALLLLQIQAKMAQTGTFTASTAGVRMRELPNSERMRQRCSIHRFRRRFSVYELASERVELFTYVQQWLLPLRGEVVHSWRANGHCCV